MASRQIASTPQPRRHLTAWRYVSRYLDLRKAASKNLVGASDVVTYTLYVENIGTHNAYDIGLVDLLPGRQLPAGREHSGDLSFPEPGREGSGSM